MSGWLSVEGVCLSCCRWWVCAPARSFTKEHQNKSAKWHCGRHTLICKKNSN